MEKSHNGYGTKSNDVIVNKQQTNITFILWVVFFCYSICAALIFQALILPYLSSIQTGSGSITTDAVYFDKVASSLASEIKANGWNSWRLYPSNGAPGNVAILGALYVIFGYDPSLAIPINAALHAMGGLLIFLLARELASKESIGNYAGVIAGSLFVIFPSALVWYGQNHKDSYAIAGILLVLFVWVKVLKGPATNRSWCFWILGSLAGIALVGIARPFILKILLVAVIGILIVLVVNVILRKKVSDYKKLIGFFLIVVVMLLGVSKITVLLGSVQSDESYTTWQDQTNGTNDEWKWSDSTWLWNNIEKYIETASKTRAGLIEYGVGLKAKSMIDEDIKPHNVLEVSTYIPRALLVALFAPFPSTWLADVSMPKLVVMGEMLIYYLCLPGIIILLFYNRKPAVWMVFLLLFFSC